MSSYNNFNITIALNVLVRSLKILRMALKILWMAITYPRDGPQGNIQQHRKMMMRKKNTIYCNKKMLHNKFETNFILNK